MDTALTQKFPFILDRNLAKANCTEKKSLPKIQALNSLPTYSVEGFVKLIFSTN